MATRWSPRGAAPSGKLDTSCVTAGTLGLDLLVGAATVLAAIVAARLAHGVGLPALLVFLGLGLILGESVLGIRFDNTDLTETLGLGALVLILAEGGLTTNWATPGGPPPPRSRWRPSA